MITLRWLLEVYTTLTGWSKPYECTLQPGEVRHLCCLLFTAFQLALLRLGAVASWDLHMLSRCQSKPHACTNFIVHSRSHHLALMVMSVFERQCLALISRISLRIADLCSSWTDHITLMVMSVFEQQKCSVLVNYSMCSPQECLCCSCLTYIPMSYYHFN